MNDAEGHLFWAKMQMDEANTSPGTRMVVEKMLSTFLDEVTGPVQGEDILAIFNKLVAGHALVQAPVEEHGRWEDARPGNLVVRDVVRVKSTAYPGQAGIAHNGRTGVIVAMSQGDIRVKYSDDRQPNPDWVAHSPYALEKRVPI